jgi:hypothetical protein
MFGPFARKLPVRILSGTLALILVLGALMALSACGDSGGNITPPPATIIRAGDSPTASVAPAVKGQATAAAPARPQVTPPSTDYPAGTGPYPSGASAYPSPTK